MRVPAALRDERSGRVLAFLLVLLIHVGLALLILLLGPTIKLAEMGRNAIEAFNIPAPEAEPEAEPEQAEPPPPAAAPTPQPRPTPQPAQLPTIDAPAPPIDLGVLPIELDIRKIPNRRVEQEVAEAEAETNQPDSKVVSTGRVYGPSLNSTPSFLAGKTLYAAEWHREPTDAELAFYLPKTGIPRGAWATVACRTVANFRVEDCQEMGDSQPGSGLSRAIRNAAWQFRVRPPRVDGRYKVGEWVQIRIDFTEPPPAG
ncbi:hypothetical protein GCM10007973_21900 [Polymorphobacter multimanifer]|uniref:Protein TonB n=1 Tax=Polymorphobacter multimanifer TaxID=1070431 RepID=A0A841LG42_9SPHN|nr:hypothetical protein [Polymorphobacter multimanifer]MBB6227938.1 protein TonB [Polymorphobacter multimanifer]GGI84907.1 hypothetical protein GCM10007973_21900 [Polymorphobacter multimanifer]